MAIFEDHSDRVLLMSLSTGAVREGPWISLRTPRGTVYFANLVSRATRWFPPQLWMHGWIERPEPSSRNDIFSTYARPRSLQIVLSCAAARRTVEGGAPYMYDDSQGLPQYDADEADTVDTYPM